MGNYSLIYKQFSEPPAYQLAYDNNTGNIYIGGGYNLSSHSAEEIITDLTRAGFDNFTAHTLAEAAHKTDIEAQNWVNQNRFFMLSEQQHQNIFSHIIIPEYEEKLSQQLDALHEMYPANFPENQENLSDTQKQILYHFVDKGELGQHPELVIAVLNEDWETVKAELHNFDAGIYQDASHDILNTFFAEGNSSATFESDSQPEGYEAIQLRIPTNYDFTYNQEIGHQGQSLVPHFPGGKSGVTIGPGYDMSLRSPEEIYQDLTSAGIDTKTVEILMQAANKSGPEAQAWIASHQDIHITEEQQRYLFYNILVPQYEERTQQQLENFLESHPEIDPTLADWDNLSDKQKQMLFDFTYNAGLEKFPTFVNAVLEEDWEKAYQSFERYSAGELLAYRNESFYDEFLDDNLHHNYQSWHDLPNDDTDHHAYLGM